MSILEKLPAPFRRFTVILGFAYFLLSFLFIWVYVITGTLHHEVSSRKTAAEAARLADYNNCVSAVPVVAKMNAAIGAAAEVGFVLLQNSEETHMVTPAGTAVYRQQQVNIERLRRALVAGAGVHIPWPTKQECATRYRP